MCAGLNRQVTNEWKIYSKNHSTWSIQSNLNRLLVGTGRGCFCHVFSSIFRVVHFSLFDRQTLDLVI